MRVAIIGDSFTHTYKNTWIEQVCNELSLEVIHQVGFRGQSQYKIYLDFLEVVKNNPDIIICCHTEHSRTYHPTEVIHYNILNYYDNFSKIIKSKEIINAAKEYYLHIYDEGFSKFIHNSIIDNMQKICKKNNIKLINIPCFDHDHIIKNYGLWFLTNDGLIVCSREDYKKVNSVVWTNIHDNRLNHFSSHGHQILANNIIPHIKTYINSDQEFHISLLFPELFA
jgi:hypothetical protein